MSQIAQQDHLYLEIGELSFDEGAEVSELLWQKFKELAKNGTLLDAVLRNDYGSVAKITGYQFEEGELLFVFAAVSGNVIGYESPEE